MASIIDLETGALIEKEIDQPSQELPDPVEQQRQIIDLNTGQIIDKDPQAQIQAVQQGQAPQIDPNILAQAQQRRQAVLQAPTTPFPEEREQTRAAQELPELGTGGLLAGEDQAKVAAITPVLLTTTNPEELGNILSSNFPNVGIQSDPGGNLIATNNATGARVVINQPGLSQLDILQGLGIAAAFTPAGRAAGLVPAAAGLTGKVAAGAAASGLTQTVIEGIQSLVGGELNEEEIALATVLGGAAETVVPAIQAVRQARRAKVLDVSRAEVAETVERIAPAREAQAAVQETTGVEVPLFQAQQTGQPSTLLKQRLLPQLDAGAKKAAAELENQNKQAFDATAELVNTIAPAEVVETGAKRFRTAAQKALEAGKERRRAATSGLYEEALEAGADVDLTPVQATIKAALDGAPETGKFAATINKVKSLIGTGKRTSTGVTISPEGLLVQKGKVVQPSLRQLQKAKFEIDEMLEAFGENALGNTTKREVLGIQKALVKQMELASPGYKAANEQFKRLSPAVAELQDSILGSISKLDDVSLKNVSRRIFDVTESNPAVVRKAKQIIDQVDPGAWDDLLRVELQRRIGGIETLAEDLPGELVGNVPGQLRRAIFGNPGQRKTLLAGMSAEQRKNFVYLDDVLRRASSGRQAGSPTAPFGEVLDRLRGSAGVIRDMILRPLDSLQKTGERGLFDRNVSKLTEVLFNPKWEPKLRELRNVPPRSERAKVILTELINSAKAAPQVIDISETQSQ
jgi:hypothetical protein